MAKSINEYIAQFPHEIQVVLEQVRMTIHEAAPDAKEDIKWSMPAFMYHGILVLFAAHKSHLGFYPIPTSIDAFKEELSKYKSGKGSVQFPYSEPMPLELISKIVKFRVQENLEKAKK